MVMIACPKKEMFYNSNLWHSYLGYLSPINVEKLSHIKKQPRKMSVFIGPHQFLFA